MLAINKLILLLLLEARMQLNLKLNSYWSKLHMVHQSQINLPFLKNLISQQLIETNQQEKV